MTRTTLLTAKSWAFGLTALRRQAPALSVTVTHTLALTLARASLFDLLAVNVLPRLRQRKAQEY